MVNIPWNGCAAGTENVEMHQPPPPPPMTNRLKTHKHNFYLCQWQTNTEGSLLYLFYRWLVAITFLGVVVCSILDVGRTDPITEHHYLKWFIYLTNWGMISCALQAWLGALIVTGGMMIVREEFSLDNPKKKNIFYKMYWFFYTIATVYSFIITIMYWAVVYDPEINKVNAVNIMSHVLNSALMLIDLVVVGHPIKVQHAYQTIGLGVIYMVFTIVYFLVDGTNRRDETYIYAALDWNKPGKTLAVSIGGLILVFIVHLCCYIVYRARVCIYNACCRKHNERDKFSGLARTLSTLENSQREHFLNPTTIVDLKV